MLRNFFFGCAILNRQTNCFFVLELRCLLEISMELQSVSVYIRGFWQTKVSVISIQIILFLPVEAHRYNFAHRIKTKIFFEPKRISVRCSHVKIPRHRYCCNMSAHNTNLSNDPFLVDQISTTPSNPTSRTQIDDDYA